MIMVKQIYIIY